MSMTIDTNIPFTASKRAMRSTGDLWSYGAQYEQSRLNITPIVDENGNVRYYDENKVELTRQFVKPVLKHITMKNTALGCDVRIENILYIRRDRVDHHPRGMTVLCAKDFHDSFAVRENGGKPYPYHKGRYIR
jgi:hypothetical protein